MSVNRHRAHVLVLPEDDANRQIANGFLLDPAIQARAIQVLEVAGGWKMVADSFEKDHIRGMSKNPNRSMVLLIDFDEHLEERTEFIRGKIPVDLADRVYVIGARNEPEDLRAAGLGSYETIGQNLAKDCRDGTDVTWSHDQLKHNGAELGRLRAGVRPFLFQST